MAKKISREDHIKRHGELHRALDELMADYITHTKGLPVETTVMQLMEWSHKQMTEPEGE